MLANAEVVHRHDDPIEHGDDSHPFPPMFRQPITTLSSSARRPIIVALWLWSKHVANSPALVPQNWVIIRGGQSQDSGEGQDTGGQQWGRATQRTQKHLTRRHAW